MDGPTDGVGVYGCMGARYILAYTAINRGDGMGDGVGWMVL